MYILSKRKKEKKEIKYKQKIYLKNKNSSDKLTNSFLNKLKKYLKKEKKRKKIGNIKYKRRDEYLQSESINKFNGKRLKKLSFLLINFCRKEKKIQRKHR